VNEQPSHLGAKQAFAQGIQTPRPKEVQQKVLEKTDQPQIACPRRMQDPLKIFKGKISRNDHSPQGVAVTASVVTPFQHAENGCIAGLLCSLLDGFVVGTAGDGEELYWFLHDPFEDFF